MQSWEISDEENIGVVGPRVNVLLNFFQFVSEFNIGAVNKELFHYSDAVRMTQSVGKFRFFI